MEQVKVIIPVYHPVLSESEQASLRQTVRMLGRYPLVLLHPQGMEVNFILDGLPQLQPLAVSDEWLGLRNGIAGYNRMMLSADFYDLFPDTEYILVCHTDAWIFRDELSEWCSRGYDCVAAPWVRRSVYDLPLLKQWHALRRWQARRGGTAVRQQLYGRVGNGGLSLRRVASFRAACDRYAPQIVKYVERKHHLYNEDVFWALVPVEFRYPAWQEALRFAFDTNPAYCYGLCGERLPFGCHSWSKDRMWRFWNKIIPFRK